ncbi:trihelix transcription factor GT-3b-like [Phragmites australis]|uniref:trihelix transcription factor GT-3b-like n=1 Tax=Phragmites australis TaxID=29695 RepID=UPI002D773E83|nr:trihelix transcription factor GT-3b-like [Phragmites australis]
MDPFHHLNTSFSNPYHPLLSPSPPHHPHFPPLPPPPPLAAELPQSSAGALERERLPQWSHAETAAFLAIRAELDHSFLTTKRNKALWESVSARLGAQGFSRTPDQCKSKWKNLVTRFKGTEAAAAQPADADTAAAQAARQFPFHDEMRRIFDARAERAQALERKKAKGKDVRPEDDEGGGEGEEEEEEELEVEMGEEEGGRGGGAKKRRRKQAARTWVADQGEVEAMLREFMRRQVEMEEKWMEAAEAREAERRAREEQWRTAMVALGEERLELVRRWREREDAWRARAEEREERRHQLVAALLAKLGGDAS